MSPCCELAPAAYLAITFLSEKRFVLAVQNAEAFSIQKHQFYNKLLECWEKPGDVATQWGVIRF